MSILPVVIVLIGFFSCGEARSHRYHSHELHDGRRQHDQKARNMDWDFFMLVTEWPFSSCEQQNATHQHECVIPKEVKGWTLHGLWPSCNNGKYPQFCSDEKFDWSKVEDLNDRLVADWANLFVDEAGTSFWKHEFEKHGTCAESVQGFETQHSFFKVTLDLRDKYDMKSILGDQGIVPSNKPYQGSDIKAAINKGLDVKACASCSKIKGIDGYVLMTTTVCIGKSLELLDCPYCEHECFDDDNVYYQPMIN